MTSSTLYENQDGLLVKPGTHECAGYIFNFVGHGAFLADGQVTTPTGPTVQEIETHNNILAKAEREAMIKAGRGTFYLSHKKPDICYGGSIYSARVSQWTGDWQSPWCYVDRKESYGFAPCYAYHVWFTGPDGKKWYGVNKGNMDCFTARRLKKQD